MIAKVDTVLINFGLDNKTRALYCVISHNKKRELCGYYFSYELQKFNGRK